MRHARSGTIRRLTRGLYDYPRTDASLGILSPSTDDIAKALSDRDSNKLQASGAHAANSLGLSTQVPVRAVFLTDGRARKVQLGKRQIVLKQTTPKQMATAGRVSGTVIQALRWIGQHNVDERTVDALKYSGRRQAATAQGSAPRARLDRRNHARRRSASGRLNRGCLPRPAR
jgi:hypothetical protein